MRFPEEVSGSDPRQDGLANEGYAMGSGLSAGQTVGGDRFRLVRLIGQGGMGMVWQAFDERLKEAVALKFISEKIRGNPQALMALRRETSRCHSLSHPGIIRIHDLQEGVGEPAFISMEYIQGPNLYQLARQREKRAFRWSEVEGWLTQLCSALDYAHSRGIIHRDLKPANLMLNASGEIKLADFGLAEILKTPEAVQERHTGGTLAYMSPQQLSGATAAIADDVYSLGACLFELLSGSPVFSGDDVPRRIAFEPAPLLPAQRESNGITDPIPEEVEDLVQQCLSKNPELRPPSAGAILRMLNRGKEDAPVQSQSSGREERTTLFGRKNFSLVLETIAAVAIVTLLAKLFLATRKPAVQTVPILDLKQAPVQASSSEGPWTPEKAFDGVHRIVAADTHRWVTASVLGDREEWIAVDLGKDMVLERIMVDWELAYARDFAVRTRTSVQGFVPDPSLWTRVGSVTGFREVKLTAVNDSASQEDVVFDFAAGRVQHGQYMAATAAEIEPFSPIARHVMINPTGRGAQNHGVYSIHEIEVAARPLNSVR